jgi:exopolysaccharide biosynthesis WecB/TagA/CpsF family protein
MNGKPLPTKSDVLGIAVSRTSYAEAAECVVRAGKERKPLALSALAVHGLMDGVIYPEFGSVLNEFDIVTPDGQPIRWALNCTGKPRLKERVYGPTLMLEICKQAEEAEVGIYLFGSTQESVDKLCRNLRQWYPALIISGAQADRFREATPEEDAEDVAKIRESGAGIVFCGRGCPRQERWCHRHRDKLNGALVAVGAAFDFHSGLVRQAPPFLQKMGLEWLFRLYCEPRRLWRRYIILNPLFVFGLLLSALRMDRLWHRLLGTLAEIRGK